MRPFDALRLRHQNNAQYRFTTIGGGEGSISSDGQTFTYSSNAGSIFFGPRTGVALSGLAYWEMEIVSQSSSSYATSVGVGEALAFAFNDTGGVNHRNTFAVRGGGPCGVTAGRWTNGSSAGGGAPYTPGLGDRMGFAFKASTRELWISKNGTWASGDPSTLTSPSVTFADGTFYPRASFYTCGSETGSAVAKIYAFASEFLYPIPTSFSAYGV